jgi:hypothetical protein
MTAVPDVGCAPRETDDGTDGAANLTNTDGRKRPPHRLG